GEPGLPNVQIDLYADTNGDGIYTPGIDTLIDTTTTDADGNYLFTELPPGDYLVVLPEGNFVPGGPLSNYFSSTGGNSEPAPSPNTNINNDDNGTRVPGVGVVASVVTLTNNDEPTNDGDTDPNTNLTVDFGFFQAAALGDFVWEDTNHNGIQDANEPGIPNVQVDLYEPGPDGIPGTPDDVLVDRTFTSDLGEYTFTGLQPGDYFVEFTPPPGYTISPPNQGDNPATDSNANPFTGRTPLINLDADEVDLTWDAGMYQSDLASLGDFVWNDINRNGLQDANEVGVENVTVNLYDSNGNLISTTTTDATGFYQFIDLLPGDYQVEFVLPDGYTFSPQQQGSDGSVDSDANPLDGLTDVVSLDAGENNPDIDAGIFQDEPGTATIGNRVWFDLNNNGIQDDGEPGVPGVIVNLYDTNGNLVDTTVTDVNGNYLFTNVPPGDYIIEVIQIPGYGFTFPNQGTDGSVDSDIDPDTGQSDTITVGPGENNTDIDAGLVVEGTVAIELEKVAELVSVAPNQIITFRLRATNNSTAMVLSPVRITDELPDGMTFIEGSASPVQPIAIGRTLIWNDVTQGVGLQPGESVDITFEAIVTTEIGTYINIGIVEGEYPGGSVTDSDDASVIVSDPVVEVNKGVATPGLVNGVITFTIRITNTGPSTIVNLPLFDRFQGPIAYVGGSVVADEVDNVNQVLGWNDVTDSLGPLDPGEVFEIQTRFELIDDGITESEIVNVVEVVGAEDEAGNRVNDQADSAITTIDPSAIELLSFRAIYQPDGVQLTWITGAEIDTWGFHLLRSNDNNRANAVQVTPALILARGRSNSGALYAWFDQSATATGPYVYWLQEIELDGTINEYGPFSARLPGIQNAHQVFLPVITR
ncbi:MAG: DUF11 domain-containing protein, partial [Chloroflexaceae bacterium]|nr:DUF11 domain-containing protein [Chloroflexaceae bacterium]